MKDNSLINIFALILSLVSIFISLKSLNISNTVNFNKAYNNAIQKTVGYKNKKKLFEAKVAIANNDTNNTTNQVYLSEIKGLR